MKLESRSLMILTVFPGKMAQTFCSSLPSSTLAIAFAPPKSSTCHCSIGDDPYGMLRQGFQRGWILVALCPNSLVFASWHNPHPFETDLYKQAGALLATLNSVVQPQTYESTVMEAHAVALLRTGIPTTAVHASQAWLLALPSSSTQSKCTFPSHDLGICYTLSVRWIAIRNY